MDDNALGSFLRSRRATIRPDDAGLPVFGRRRVPGLRREELAQLAGVSPDYYMRLEQGRGANVSDSVLNAIARVLRLDPTEREHLYNLVRPARDPVTPDQRVRPGMRELLRMMEQVPAFVLGRRMDVLAWNALGNAIMDFDSWPPGPRNVTRQIFLDPRAIDFYPEWEQVAAEAVAHLRLDAGRHPADKSLTALVQELSAAGPTFADLWAGQQVRAKTFGRKLICHPVVGRLDLTYETLGLPGEPDQVLVAYTAASATETSERLERLLRATERTAEGATEGMAERAVECHPMPIGRR